MDKRANQMGYLSLNGKQYPLHIGHNVIGRNKGAAVILKNLEVSHVHAVITITDSEHYISDFNSVNGTCIDNVSMVPYRLYEINSGTIIVFSKCVTAIYRKGTVTSVNENTQIMDDRFYSHDTQIMNVTNSLDKKSFVESNSNVIDILDDGMDFSTVNTQINEALTQIIINDMQTQLIQCDFKNATFDSSDETQMNKSSKKSITFVKPITDTSNSIKSSNSQTSKATIGPSSEGNSRFLDNSHSVDTEEQNQQPIDIISLHTATDDSSNESVDFSKGVSDENRSSLGLQNQQTSSNSQGPLTEEKRNNSIQNQQSPTKAKESSSDTEVDSNNDTKNSGPNKKIHENADNLMDSRSIIPEANSDSGDETQVELDKDEISNLNACQLQNNCFGQILHENIGDTLISEESKLLEKPPLVTETGDVRLTNLFNVVEPPSSATNSPASVENAEVVTNSAEIESSSIDESPSQLHTNLLKKKSSNRIFSESSGNATETGNEIEEVSQLHTELLKRKSIRRISDSPDSPLFNTGEDSPCHLHIEILKRKSTKRINSDESESDLIQPNVKADCETSGTEIETIDKSESIIKKSKRTKKSKHKKMIIKSDSESEEEIRSQSKGKLSKLKFNKEVSRNISDTSDTDVETESKNQVSYVNTTTDIEESVNQSKSFLDVSNDIIPATQEKHCDNVPGGNASARLSMIESTEEFSLNLSLSEENMNVNLTKNLESNTDYETETFKESEDFDFIVPTRKVLSAQNVVSTPENIKMIASAKNQMSASENIQKCIEDAEKCDFTAPTQRICDDNENTQIYGIDFDAPTQKVIVEKIPNDFITKEDGTESDIFSTATQRNEDNADDFNDSDFCVPTQKVNSHPNEEIFWAPTQISKRSKPFCKLSTKNANNDFDFDIPTQKIIRSPKQIGTNDDEHTTNLVQSNLDEENCFSMPTQNINDNFIFSELTQPISGEKSREKFFDLTQQAILNNPSHAINDFLMPTQKVTKGTQSPDTSKVASGNEIEPATEVVFDLPTQRLVVDNVNDNSASKEDDTVIVISKECNIRELNEMDKSPITKIKEKTKTNDSPGIESQLELIFASQLPSTSFSNHSRPTNPLAQILEENTTQEMENQLLDTNECVDLTDSPKSMKILKFPKLSTVKSSGSNLNDTSTSMQDNENKPMLTHKKRVSVQNVTRSKIPKSDTIVSLDENVGRRSTRILSNTSSESNVNVDKLKRTRRTSVQDESKIVAHNLEDDIESTTSKRSKRYRKQSDGDVSIALASKVHSPKDVDNLLVKGRTSKRLKDKITSLSDDEIEPKKDTAPITRLSRKVKRSVASSVGIGNVKDESFAEVHKMQENRTEAQKNSNKLLIDLTEEITTRSNRMRSKINSSPTNLTLVEIDELKPKRNTRTTDTSSTFRSVKILEDRRYTTACTSKKKPPSEKINSLIKLGNRDDDDDLNLTVPKQQVSFAIQTDKTLNLEGAKTSPKRNRKQKLIVLEDSDSSNSVTFVNVMPKKRKKVEQIAVVTTPKRKLKPKIVFTMFDSPELRALIKSLGGQLVDSIDACTVLVTQKVLRSQKLLSAIGEGKPICTPDWLYECKKAKAFTDPWDNLILDTEAEKKWHFSLKTSFERSRVNKLFKGHYFTLVVDNAADVLKGAIESCGGKVVVRPPGSGKFIVVASPECKAKCNKYYKQNVKVVLPEAIFDGVLRQEIVFDKYLLN